jgi:hypothetical protein
MPAVHPERSAGEVRAQSKGHGHDRSPAAGVSSVGGFVAEGTLRRVQGERISILLLAALLAFSCGGKNQNTIALGDPCDPQATPDNGFALCSSGLCVSLDNVSGFCSLQCMTDNDCGGEGFLCQGAGRYGRICKRTTGCKTDDDCPSGHTCDAMSGNCYIKVERTLCSPCQDADQCPMGGACFTAVSSKEQFCTTACGTNDACPLGFSCQMIPAGAMGAMIKQCAPDSMSCNAGKPLCAPCKGDAECGGPFDLCVRNVVSGEEFCGRDCNPAKNICPNDAGCDPSSLGSAENPECPTGFSCTDIGGGVDPTVKGPYQCVPNSNTCVDYCDATTEADELKQCGLGKRCLNNKCTPATDGRMCTPCTTTDDCRGGAHPENRCIVNDCPNCPFKGEAFCTTPCTDDLACQHSFGTGFVCKPVLDTDGSMINMCMPQRGTCASGIGRLGDDCTVNGAQDCLNGVCLGAGTTSLCSEFCAHDADCQDLRYHCCQITANGYDCSDSQRMGDGPLTAPGVCAPLGGLFGDDCTPGRPPCQTGTCLDLGTAQVCTVTCPDMMCPAGFTCRVASPDNMSGTVNVCFPNGGGGAGADCTFGPAACSSGYCIRKDSGSVCTQTCTDDQGCPTDWICQPLVDVTMAPVQACLPPSLQP